MVGCALDTVTRKEVNMYNVIVLVHGNMHPHVGRFHSYDIAMRYAMEWKTKGFMVVIDQELRCFKVWP